MAIDFEKEEKRRRWMFILPVAVLALALCASISTCMGKSSALKKLNLEHKITTLELESYRKLYVSKASDVRGSEQMADFADFQLQSCLRENTQLKDQLGALELTLNSGLVNAQ